MGLRRSQAVRHGRPLRSARASVLESRRAAVLASRNPGRLTRRSASCSGRRVLIHRWRAAASPVLASGRTVLPSGRTTLTLPRRDTRAGRTAPRRATRRESRDRGEHDEAERRDERGTHPPRQSRASPASCECDTACQVDPSTPCRHRSVDSRHLFLLPLIDARTLDARIQETLKPCVARFQPARDIAECSQRGSVRRRSVLRSGMRSLVDCHERPRLRSPLRLAVLCSIEVDRGEVPRDLEEQLLAIDVDQLVHGSTFSGGAQDPLNELRSGVGSARRPRSHGYRVHRPRRRMRRHGDR